MAPVRVHAALLVGLVGSMLAGCQSVAVLSDPDAATGGPIGTTESALNRVGDLFVGPDTSVEAQQLLGDRLASQALGRAKRADDEALEGYLSGIARRIAAHTDARTFDFRVYLVEDRRPNAFTPGGGHIFITTGLVSRLRTEAQMAMVLSHEIAHNAEAHIVKGAHRRAVSRRATNASKTVFDDKLGLSWVGQKIGSAINATVNVYTSDQEDAADELGLDYMIAAGYDPNQAVA
ncbi:MAG: M48 family metalloprotease, partial [Parvibaculaceae bacterium]